MRNLFLIAFLLCAVTGLSVARRNQGGGRKRSCTPQNCVVHEWTTFKKCSKPCGGGYLVQRRRINKNQVVVVRLVRITTLLNVVDVFHVTLNAVLFTACESGIPEVRTRVALFPNKLERCLLHENPSAAEQRVRRHGRKREAVILESKLSGFPLLICFPKKFLWAGSILYTLIFLLFDRRQFLSACLMTCKLHGNSSKGFAFFIQKLLSATVWFHRWEIDDWKQATKEYYVFWKEQHFVVFNL